MRWEIPGAWMLGRSHGKELRTTTAGRNEGELQQDNGVLGVVSLGRLDVGIRVVRKHKPLDTSRLCFASFRRRQGLARTGRLQC